MRSLPPSGSFTEFQHAFLFRKRFVGNTFGTPFGHHDHYPETEAFRLPKIHSYESSQLIRILPKTEERSGSLCASSESLADDLTCIPRIPSISMKLCINTRPSLLQIIIFLHLKRRSQTENNIESIRSVSRH